LPQIFADPSHPSSPRIFARASTSPNRPFTLLSRAGKSSTCHGGNLRGEFQGGSFSSVVTSPTTAAWQRCLLLLWPPGMAWGPRRPRHRRTRWRHEGPVRRRNTRGMRARGLGHQGARRRSVASLPPQEPSAIASPGKTARRSGHPAGARSAATARGMGSIRGLERGGREKEMMNCDNLRRSNTSAVVTCADVPCEPRWISHKIMTQQD
jgi:hypothetical protein